MKKNYNSSNTESFNTNMMYSKYSKEEIKNFLIKFKYSWSNKVDNLLDHFPCHCHLLRHTCYPCQLNKLKNNIINKGK